jgi:hypothetical protein
MPRTISDVYAFGEKEHVADQIVTLKSNEGISWKEVAVVANISPQTIYNMLSGKF